MGSLRPELGVALVECSGQPRALELSCHLVGSDKKLFVAVWTIMSWDMFV